MTVSCDDLVIMGGSSQGIEKPFASDLLVRAPWPTPFLAQLDTTGRLAGGDLLFHEWLPGFRRSSCHAVCTAGVCLTRNARIE